MNTTIHCIGAPLQWIPILHGCGHFEARLTRWGEFNTRVTVETPATCGYIAAGSPCTTCAPQGRPVRKNFQTLEDVQAHCATQNAERNIK